MAVIVWFHDIGVHVKLALFFILIFTEQAHSLFDFMFWYTTFLERTCLSCLISILRFSILISRNWYSRQPRSFAFGITLSTQNRVAHTVWKNSTDQGRLNQFYFSRGCFLPASISIGSVFWFHWIGVHVKLALSLSALRWAQNRVAHTVWHTSPYRGRMNCFHFSRDCLMAAGISIGSVFWFFHEIGAHVKPTLLLSALCWPRNRVAHQVWKNSPYLGRLNYFHFFEELSFGCWHLHRLSILISLACTSSPLVYFRHYVEHRTAMDNVIDLDLIFSKIYTFVDRNILVSPDVWAPIPYASKLTGIDEIIKVNQQSATDMRIAVQYESGWNFSGWVVGVEKGNCDHYKVCVRIYVHVYVVSMKRYYLTYRITIFGDSIWYVHLTYSISMMMLMRRHTKDGYGLALSLKTGQIDVANYVCWIPQSMAWINPDHSA